MKKPRKPDGAPTELGFSGGPNGARIAALAYLKAAETLYEKETGRDGFWYIAEWYVVHHLAFISVELFIKSFTAQIATDSYSADNETTFTMTETSHGERLTASSNPRVLSALSSDQILTLQNLSNNELNRGRYPYEPIETSNSNELSERFPPGDLGRKLTDEWLDLARALSNLST